MGAATAAQNSTRVNAPHVTLQVSDVLQAAMATNDGTTESCHHDQPRQQAAVENDHSMPLYAGFQALVHTKFALTVNITDSAQAAVDANTGLRETVILCVGTLACARKSPA